MQEEGNGACGHHFWTPPHIIRLPFEEVEGVQMAWVASVLLPVHTSPGRGCEHNPAHCPMCMTPAPHLLHATCTSSCMQGGVCRVACKRWGAGVVHMECTQGHV